MLKASWSVWLPMSPTLSKWRRTFWRLNQLRCMELVEMVKQSLVKMVAVDLEKDSRLVIGLSSPMLWWKERVSLTFFQRCWSEEMMPCQHIFCCALNSPYTHNYNTMLLCWPIKLVCLLDQIPLHYRYRTWRYVTKVAHQPQNDTFNDLLWVDIDIVKGG